MRASYRFGIAWMAENDDTDWLDDLTDHSPSVTACLLADLFGKTTEQVARDLRIYSRKKREARAALAKVTP